MKILNVVSLILCVSWPYFSQATVLGIEEIWQQAPADKEGGDTQAPPRYPWDRKSPHPPITPFHFRCKGHIQNPIKHVEDSAGESEALMDCAGRGDHGLPARAGKEFVYPILCTLLNMIQEKTGHAVKVTSGHRCPTHNRYADPSSFNSTSKHQIGAEVDFYVKGMEESPLTIIQLIQDFYAEEESQAMRTFQRYEKGNTNVSTPPWYNREVFLKLFLQGEGRDADNQHPFPYICIQVRWDRDRSERVVYDWNRAQKGYLRR